MFIRAAGLGAGKNTVPLLDGMVGVPDFNIVRDVVGTITAEKLLLIGNTIQNVHLTAYYMRKTHKFQYAIFA